MTTTDVYDSGLRLKNKAQVLRDLEDAEGAAATALAALRAFVPPKPTSRLEALRNDFFRSTLRELYEATDALTRTRAAVVDLFPAASGGAEAPAGD